ncbi:MAG: DinB family protein [Pyrinomonadaceae bacterium]|nr:DinB family protein [Pyrinomonadaceae bacterium]
MEVERLTLSPATGVTPGIGFYLSGLDEVREQLRETVGSMSDEQIARRAVEGAHPIGGLVLHIGEAEWWWIQCVVSGRLEMTDEDKRIAHWDVLEDPEGFGALRYSAAYCLDAIDGIRRRTRDLLASLTDDDLERTYSYKRRDKRVEVSLRWVLHHLMDHEAQHKGQILMLKRMLG